jgi:hypothetical protein
MNQRELKDPHGVIVGELWTGHVKNAEASPPEGALIDLVAISGNTGQNILWEQGMSIVDLPHLFVMRIEWSGTIAYRKGIGRVYQDLWRMQQPRIIDLILG